MGIAGGKFSTPRMIPECAGLPTIGEPADDTFARIDRREEAASSGSTGYGADRSGYQGHSNCVGKGLAATIYPRFRLWRVVRNMRPAGQNNKSPSRSGRNKIVTDENTDEVAGTANSSDTPPAVGSIIGIHLLGGVVGLHPERVSSTVTAEAAVNVNELEIDSGPPLSVTGGGDFGKVVVGVATLAVAEVASSAYFAGAASPADLAGMAFPAVAGIGIPAVVGAVPLTDVAGMVFLAAAGGYPQPSVLVSHFLPLPKWISCLLPRRHPRQI